MRRSLASTSPPMSANAVPERAVERVGGLDHKTALLIIEPYYQAVQEQFMERGLSLCKQTRLESRDDVRDTPRHYAGCRDDGKLIVVCAPSMADLDESMVLAILAHELGHAADFLYPGRWKLLDSGALEDCAREDTHAARWGKWVSSWSRRPHDVVERTADAVASLVLGVPIGYSGPSCLQTLKPGHPPRPEGLR